MKCGTLPRSLSLTEVLLVGDVRRILGDIPALSLETVLLHGEGATRFMGIDALTCAVICEFADIRGVALPTRTICAP